MVGEYRDSPLGSPSRSSPARGLPSSPTKRTSLLQQYRSTAESPSRPRMTSSDPVYAEPPPTEDDSITASFLEDDDQGERDFQTRFPQLDEHDGASAPVSTGKTSIETPSSLFDRARYESRSNEHEDDAEDEQQRTIKSRNNASDLDSAFSRTRITDSHDTQHQVRSVPNSRPLPVPPPKPSFSSKPNVPSVASLQSMQLPRPASPASSVGSASTPSLSSAQEGSIESVNTPPAPRVGVGFNANLGVIGSSGPDLCRRCGTIVYHAEKVIAGGHKCVQASKPRLRC